MSVLEMLFFERLLWFFQCAASQTEQKQEGGARAGVRWIAARKYNATFLLSVMLTFRQRPFLRVDRRREEHCPPNNNNQRVKEGRERV